MAWAKYTTPVGTAQPTPPGGRRSTLLVEIIAELLNQASSLGLLPYQISILLLMAVRC
jgi:hypothetical protein